MKKYRVRETFGYYIIEKEVITQTAILFIIPERHEWKPCDHNGEPTLMDWMVLNFTTKELAEEQMKSYA